ncbi:MAG TPA: methyl-accepting chemotaxis protein [Phenylobacterium sp.]|nr:methyl-accepting chemotaxis protein [Phenylobacterium sp.]
MFENLAEQRRFGDRVLTGLLWALAPIVAVTALAVKGPWIMLGLSAAAIAAAATGVRKMDDGGPATRITVSVGLMGVTSLLVAAFAGRAWQIDMHMAYFAALAALVIYCDWTVILAGAGMVAAHHLLLNLVLPAAVFPGGGDLARVILHAVILVAEAVALMWASQNIAKMFDRSSVLLDRAHEATREAEDAMRAAEEARFAESHAAEERQSLQSFVEQERLAVVRNLAEALGHLAQGDLAYRIDATFPSEYEQLRADFNGAIGRLSTTLNEIIGGAGAIRSGAGEISSAADDLSRRTEQQAASLEETAAALDQITVTVRKTASGAKTASDVVLAARGDAQTSGDVVRQAVKAMSEIEDSSSRIGQIIGVIDEIAFQTNLLALNAGVEAARAGDAGRGFAVVASEVRALAQRSADAAKEIKALISASASQVQSGVKLVGETGQVLQRIVDRVAEIDTLVTEIAASAQEQATGLHQVNTAINEMDQVTQQNAAMVEQSTAASHSLAQEAEGLAESVSRFRVEHGQADQDDHPVRRQPMVRAASHHRASSRAAVAALRRPQAEADGWEEF